MAPRKSLTDAGAAATLTPALSAAWIASAPQGQLLSRLLSTSAALDVLPDPPAATAGASAPLSPYYSLAATADAGSGDGLLQRQGTATSYPNLNGLLAELMQRAVAAYPSVEVRAVWLACVADLLRLALGHQSAHTAATFAHGAKSVAPQLVLTAEQCKTVFAALQEVLVAAAAAAGAEGGAAGKGAAAKGGRQMAADDNAAYAQAGLQGLVRKALDALSTCHALVPIAAAAKPKEAEVTRLFGLLLGASAAHDFDDDATVAAAAAAAAEDEDWGPEGSDNENGAEKAAAAAVGAKAKANKKGATGNGAFGAAGAGRDETFVAATASALGDLTTAAAILYGGSDATLLGEAGALFTLSTAQLRVLLTAVQLHTVGATVPFARRVAGAFFRRHEDTVQHTLTQALVGGAFEAACTELQRLDVLASSAGADAATTAERKQQVGKLTRAVEQVAAVATVAPNAVALALPSLVAAAAQSDVVDARLAVVAGLGRAFTAPGSTLMTDYTAAFFSLVSRVQDPKGAVRVQAVQLLCRALASVADRGAMQDGLWSQLPAMLAARLSDPEESVRKATLIAVVDLAASPAGARTPSSLLQAAGQRCLDRRPAVRALAVERMAKLYALVRGAATLGPRVAWIPARIFEALHIEGSDPFVGERSLSWMLPAPAKVAAAATAPAAATAAPKPGGKKAVQKQPSILFSFEQQLLARQQQKQQGDNAASDINSTFAQGLVTLVLDLCTKAAAPTAAAAATAAATTATTSAHYDTLLTMLRKKAQLRVAVLRFFELRAQAKDMRGKFDTAEGKATLSKIERLNGFLAQISHAPGDEWATLFKHKDESVAKAFVALCSAGEQSGKPLCSDFYEAAQRVRAAVATVGKRDLTTFVENNLLHRLALPLSEAHVSELVQIAVATRQRYTQAVQAAVAAEGAAASAQSAAGAKKKGSAAHAAAEDAAEAAEGASAEAEAALQRREAATRALRAVAAFAPHMLAPAPHLGAVLEWLVKDAAVADLPTAQSGANVALLQLLAAVVSYATSTAGADAEEDEDVAAIADVAPVVALTAAMRRMLRERRKEVGEALGRFVLHTRAPGVAEEAASAVMACFPQDRTLFKMLLDELRRRLDAVDATQHYDAWPAQTASWLCAFSTFAASPVGRGYLAAVGDHVAASATRLLLAAAVAVSSAATVDETTAATTKRGQALLATAAATAAPTAVVVAWASSALAEYAVGLPAARALPACRDALLSLVDGMRRSSEQGALGTVASVLKRAALHRALLRVLRQLQATTGGAAASSEGAKVTNMAEAQIATCIAAEESPYVRAAVQRALVDRTVAGNDPDARLFALYFLAVAAEDVTKQQYAHARALLQHATQKMQATRAACATQRGAEDLPMNDPAALRCCIEYCVPFLTVYMAHQALLPQQRALGYPGYQRAWHLLLDEVLRLRGPAVAAPFLNEMFRRLRQLDDAAEPTSLATREVAELGWRVLTALLATRTVGADAAPGAVYPESVLLPRCFAQPAQGAKAKAAAAAAEGSLIDEKKTNIGPNPPFRLPQSLSGGGAAAGAAAAGADEGEEDAAAAAAQETADAVAAAYGIDAPTPAKTAGARRARAGSAAVAARPTAATTVTVTAAGDAAPVTADNSEPASPTRVIGARGEQLRVKRAIAAVEVPEGMDSDVAAALADEFSTESTESLLSIKMVELRTRVEAAVGRPMTHADKQHIKAYATSLIQAISV